MIETNIVRYWRTRPANSITRREGVLLLDKVVDRGSPVMANPVGALPRRCFGLRSRAECSRRARLSPLGVQRLEKARNRRLSDKKSGSSGRSSHGRDSAPKCALP